MPTALLAAVLALLLAPAAAPTAAQTAEAPAARPPEPAPRALLLVEMVDDEGEPLFEPPAELPPGSVRVLRGGVPVAATAAGVTAPDRVVVYFDLPLLTTQQVLGAAGTLSDRAADLVALADVQLVIGDDSSRTVLPASRDPEIVSQSLSGVGARYGGRDGLAEIRERFLDELRAVAGPPSSERRGDAPLPAHLVERVERLAQESLAAEADLLRAQRERLMLWAAREGALGPDGAAALLLVTGGFDQDPLRFYRRALEAHDLRDEVADRLERPVILPSLEELGRVLAAYGWLTYPYVSAGLSGEEASAGAGPRPGSDEGPEAPGVEDTLSRPGLDPSERGDAQRPALITPRLGRRDRGAGDGPALPPVRPEAGALGVLARDGGGELITDPLQLPGVLTRLRGRTGLLIETVPGEPERIDLEPGDAAPGGGNPTVRGARWTGETPPRSLAAVRVRRLLEGAERSGGELPVEAVFETPRGAVGEGRLLLRLGAADRPVPPREAPLRATVGIARFSGEPLVFHRDLGPDSEAAGGEEGLYQIPINLPAGAESRVAVLVEELPAGRWGSSFASSLEPGEGVRREDPDALDDEILPSPRIVRLITPGEAFVVGETTFSAVVSTPRVQRVDFFLDGDRIAVRTESPFRATLDMGAVPEPRRVEVVAYG
ncbi:MAG: hypothetical protein PVG07_08295, partial [Acidobacteriota bacterium]